MQVTLNDLINTLRDGRYRYAAGSVVTSDSPPVEIVVKAVSHADSEQSIGNLIVRSNISGKYVRVRDVALIKFQLDDEDIIYSTNQKNAINLSINKKKSADTIAVVSGIKKQVADYIEKLMTLRCLL